MSQSEQGAEPMRLESYMTVTGQIKPWSGFRAEHTIKLKAGTEYTIDQDGNHIFKCRNGKHTFVVDDICK
jgi:hypothetical protein